MKEIIFSDTPIQPVRTNQNHSLWFTHTTDYLVKNF